MPLVTVMGSLCRHLASNFNSVSHRYAGEGGARVISERCNVYFVFFLKNDEFATPLLAAVFQWWPLTYEALGLLASLEYTERMFATPVFGNI